MLSIVAVLSVAGGIAPQSPIELREGRMVTRVVEGGRNPFPKDALVAELVQAGPAYDPATSKLSWRDVKANGEGWFEGITGGYVWTAFDSPREQPMVLEATGHGMVYINGEPRGGDPYAYGYVKLPFQAKAGRNMLLFSGGRGRVKARVVTPRAAAQFETADLTIPSILTTDKGSLFGGIVVLNNTGASVRNLTIESSAGGQTASRSVPAIGPYTLRKVRFDFPAVKTDKLTVKLLQNGREVDTATVPVEVKQPTEHYKRTFISGIDGSVQYYGVAPSLMPSKDNALVLSLHGASVEASGQAAAYKPKDWATLVAATNRRPFGFDWEDWGRLDALEVLDIAKKEFPHDPSRVFLTGHSMGGHGTWSIGTMFPDRFGAIAPSAGWISFWSYGGGWEPREPNAVERLLRTAMNPSDTRGRVQNLSDLGVYILHGDKDETVPVGQARTMRDVLKPWHKDLGYHEQPGGEHWWGAECVDWPGIFEMFKRRKISAETGEIEFTTQNPGISGRHNWMTIVAPLLWSSPSWVRANRTMRNGQLILNIETKNVAALSIDTPWFTDRPYPHVTIDGAAPYKPASAKQGPKLSLVRRSGSWEIVDYNPAWKSNLRSGPFKQAFTNNMIFVYGTKGGPEENAWAYAKARFDAESFYYRGNGSIDVVSDSEAAKMRLSDRNVILYGDNNLNGMYSKLFTDLPPLFGFHGGAFGTGLSVQSGYDVAAIFMRPGQGKRQLIGVMAGLGMIGNRLLDRLPVFVSGVAYPDWTVFDAKITTEGTKGVLAAGYFGNDWSVRTGQTARKD